jgi:serine/threonine-protein kinase
MAGDRCIARFEREVQLTSRLTHPNTIAIYDFGRTPEGTFYYAMEYLPGITLEDLVREDGHQGAGRTIHIVRQVCASLAEAHGIGLIHRDIKGANIMLCERGGAYDVAKVLDFGLVKDTENPTNVTLSAANIITGTPLYLSPEAIRSPEKVDARSDIYSVGVLAYYLITGRQLFEGRNFVEVCGHHLHTPPVPPSARVSWSIPGDLERVILSCIEKDPDRRPASAKELHDALEACADSQAWKERHAERWWRENEARIKQACSRSAPTEALGRDAGGVAVTAVIEPVRTEG